MLEPWIAKIDRTVAIVPVCTEVVIEVNMNYVLIVLLLQVNTLIQLMVVVCREARSQA